MIQAHNSMDATSLYNNHCKGDVLSFSIQKGPGDGIALGEGANRVTNAETQRSMFNQLEAHARPGLEGDLIKTAAGGLPPVKRSTAEAAAQHVAAQHNEQTALMYKDQHGAGGLSKFHTRPQSLQV